MRPVKGRDFESAQSSAGIFSFLVGLGKIKLF